MIKELKNKLLKVQNLFSPTQTLVLGFILVILIGGFLLSLPVAHEKGQSVSFLDALFTATSAVCVTGLVVVDTATSYSYVGECIIMLLMQIGGIGFITFATFFAFLIGRKIGIRDRMMLSANYNQPKLQGVVRLLLFVIGLTLFFETVGFLLLSIRFVPDWGWGQGLYFSLFHSVSAFNNGGFDLFGEVKQFSSFTSYVNDPLVNFTISGLFIIGGLGFLVLYELLQFRKTKKLSLHAKVVLLSSAILLVIGTTVILLIEWFNPHTLGQLTWHSKLWAAYFQSATPRSGGINTIDLAAMYPATLLFMILLMFIGASPGSTGGGIKNTTFMLIILAVWGMMRGRESVVIFKRRIPHDQVYKALTITVLSVGLVISVTMLLTILEQTDILTALFETSSAFGTVGLSLGLTPTLSSASKILIMLTMFAGRLGPITIAFALAHKQISNSIKYPQEKLLIG